MSVNEDLVRDLMCDMTLIDLMSVVVFALKLLKTRFHVEKEIV